MPTDLPFSFRQIFHVIIHAFFPLNVFHARIIAWIIASRPVLMPTLILCFGRTHRTRTVNLVLWILVEMFVHSMLSIRIRSNFSIQFFLADRLCEILFTFRCSIMFHSFTDRDFPNSSQFLDSYELSSYEIHQETYHTSRTCHSSQPNNLCSYQSSQNNRNTYHLDRTVHDKNRICTFHSDRKFSLTILYSLHVSVISLVLNGRVCRTRTAPRHPKCRMLTITPHTLYKTNNNLSYGNFSP